MPSLDLPTPKQSRQTAERWYLLHAGFSSTFALAALQSLELNLLLGRRNAIAHGQDVGGVSPEDFMEYEQAYYEVCGRIIDRLVEAIELEQYCIEPAHGTPVI